MKTKKQLADEWIRKNGACKFDFRSRDIILPDGGLFSIEQKDVMRHKIIGRREIPNGGVEILFSKKRIVKDKEYFATIWFPELDETINYLKRLKIFLNKLGYNTKLRVKKHKVGKNKNLMA